MWRKRWLNVNEKLELGLAYLSFSVALDAKRYLPYLALHKRNK